MGKHLDFYIEGMKTGKLPIGRGDTPAWGLCECCDCDLIDEELFELMQPPYHLAKDLRSFWGIDIADCLIWTFTPLRQTIVLFMAAMNNEL